MDLPEGHNAAAEVRAAGPPSRCASSTGCCWGCLARRLLSAGFERTGGHHCIYALCASTNHQPALATSQHSLDPVHRGWLQTPCGNGRQPGQSWPGPSPRRAVPAFHVRFYWARFSSLNWSSLLHGAAAQVHQRQAAPPLLAAPLSCRGRWHRCIRARQQSGWGPAERSPGGSRGCTGA